MYGLELMEGWEFMIGNQLFIAAVGINFIPENLRGPAGFADLQLQVALTDLGMELETTIYWAPGSTNSRRDGSTRLDYDGILVPERIWTSWPLTGHCSDRASDYLLRRRTVGSQPFEQGCNQWTWRSELRGWMISTGSEPSTEDRWEGRPPMTGGPLFGQSAPFIFLYVIWKGGLYGPLQAQPLVKVGRLRSNLTVLLDTDISGYSLNTVLGPMGPDRPLQNFIWESSKLLTLVQNSQRPRSPNPGDVRSAKGRFQGEIFIRHPPGPGDRVTKVVKFSRGQTGRDILEQIHHIVGDDWYLLYGGKILDLDATLPYWFRDKTLDLMGTLKAGSPTDPDGVGEAGDTHMEGGGAGSGGPGVRGSPDGAAGDDEMAWDEEEATGEEQDGPSDLDRTRARDWCQELLNIGQLNTNAECIAMLLELFNLSEHKALTLISEHLYGSVIRSPSLVSQLRALAAKLEQEWQTFLKESGTPHPTTIAMWAELCRELVEIMELTIGVTRALDNMNIPPGMRGTWGTACMSVRTQRLEGSQAQARPR